jgi:hypothetical protein
MECNKYVCVCVYLCMYVRMYVHTRKQKLAALHIQIARQAVQWSSEFYDFL